MMQAGMNAIKKYAEKYMIYLVRFLILSKDVSDAVKEYGSEFRFMKELKD